MPALTKTPTIYELERKVSGVSPRSTVLGLTVFCVLLCVLRWNKLDSFWGDAPRWIFEAYRTALGEFPYRDFTWQYPPLAVLLSGAAFAVGGANFATIQVFVDIVGICLVLVTWDTARRFLPGRVSLAVAAVLACAGVGNATNFALFSLQVYTPAILVGAVGMLLLIRTKADYLASGSMTRNQLVWMSIGSTIGLLSKPEFIVGVLGVLVAAAWLDPLRWSRPTNRKAWARRHVRTFLLATVPAIVVYAAVMALSSPLRVSAGIGGYGTAALTCPWWPTGLGLFGGIVAVGYGLTVAALCLLLRFRKSWARYGRWNALLWAGAILSVAATAAYLPYCVAELPVFASKATAPRFLAFFLSTGTVLLPVMWIGILALFGFVFSYTRLSEKQRRQSAPFIILVTPAFLISLRGLFGGTMSQLTQVSMGAYPIWFIVGPMLLLWFLDRFEITLHPVTVTSVVLLSYALVRLAGAVVTEVSAPYSRLETDAGAIRVRDREVAPQVYAYVAAHTERGEPILDVADGGGVNFGGHRPSPIFSTQFTAFAPSAELMNTDLARIERHPPRLVIANEGETFQATYGLCMNTGCSFPSLVWRSSRLACDPSRTFPVLDYIRQHYREVAQFGGKVIYARQ